MSGELNGYKLVAARAQSDCYGGKPNHVLRDYESQYFFAGFAPLLTQW